MKRILFFLFAIAALFLSCTEKNAPTPGGSGSGGYTPTYVTAKAEFSCSVEQPLTVVIVGKNEGRSVTYDFGDGKSESHGLTETIRHKYASAGTYKIRADVKGDQSTSDSYSLSISIPSPKIYITGIRYLSVDEDGEYYKATLKDDDFWTKTWFTTNYTPILNNSRLPYEYIFKEPIYMNDLADDDYYTLYVYHSTKGGNDSGTQCLQQSILTSRITACSQSIKVENNSGNTIVELMMDYK